MIKADNLSKIFEKNQEEKKRKFFSKEADKVEFYAVKQVFFQVEKGEILGILGPNGAGKTTLLRMLGTLMEPTEGYIKITDEAGNFITDKLEMKRRIGYLSGNTKLYGRLSSRELLTMLGTVYGLEKEEIQKRIEEIFELLDMKSFGDNRIEKLSTGQTQRASISRCLIHQPDIYIFDEPTLGLDILSSEAIITFMKQEKERGKTVIYSTHYMEEAEFLCDKISMIHEGTFIATGTPEQLRKQTNTTNLRDTFMSLIRGGENLE